jgi:SpoVK/Ycf46/Vps4 family AAA+-type ATPase
MTVRAKTENNTRITLAGTPRFDSSPPVNPFAKAHDHLLYELRWLNRLLASEMLRLREANFYENLKDFRGFFIADEEVDALVRADIFEDSKIANPEINSERTALQQQAQSLRIEIGRRIAATLEQKQIFLPLVHLASCFQLTEFELQALIICLAPQVDARYEKIYGYVQNDITRKAPSIELILSLLCPSVEERLQYAPLLDANANLRHFGLIEYLENESGSSAAQHFFRADSRIYQFVLGNHHLDRRLLSEVSILPSRKWDQVVFEAKLKTRLKKLFSVNFKSTGRQGPIFFLFGRQGVGKKAIAQALCHEAGIGLAVTDIRILLQAPEMLRNKIRLILREGLLQPYAIYFDHFHSLDDKQEENPLGLRWLMDEINSFGLMTFIGSERPLPTELLDLPTILPVEIPHPNASAQKKIWKMYLNDTLQENRSRAINRLTSRFNLTGGQIMRAVQLAKRTARAIETEAKKLTVPDLFASCRIQSQPKLAALARKIEPKYSWDDLILPEEQMSQLQELASHVKHKQTVMGNWGFARKMSLGHGLNALFAGPSGTGKTMSAEVIANDLGLDLYKIDLSSVVSKYIGETEKNLNRIFTEAEHSNVILFFDEADALFGKRSEVKDAHDRYANIEVGYLLQKMEEYEGIVILATNFSRNLDDAFVRRLQFTIEFPFPTEPYRRQIWDGIWPEEMPRSQELDLDFMAGQYELAGGNIRNIALAAAYLAAEDGGVVNKDHLFRATRREFQKMGKVVAEGAFREN